MLTSSFLVGVFCLPLAARQRPQVFLYTEQEGLPSSWVEDVDQDHDDLIWAVTRGGLARFDGTEWEVMTPPQELGTPRHLARAGEAMLVLGGNLDFGLGVFREGAWDHVPPPARQQAGRGIKYAIVDGSGQLWVTTPRAVFRLRGSTWEQTGLSEETEVLDAEGLASGLLLASSTGLWKVDERGLRLVDARPCSAVGVVPGSEDQLWIADEQGLWRWDGDQRTVVYSWSLAERHLQEEGSLRADGRGGVYLVNSARLLHWTGDQMRVLNTFDGLPGDGAQAIFPDRSGNLWVAARRGLTRIPPPLFLNYGRAQGLFQDEVTSVLELAPGYLLFGHQHGLTALTAAGTRAIDLKPTMGALVATGRVLDLCQGADGHIWAALSAPGLVRLDDDFEVLRIWEGGEGTDFGHIQSVISRRDGELVVASGKGLFTLSEGELLPRPSTPDLSIRRLAETAAGRLLAATPKGAAVEQSDGSWLVAKHPTSPNANQVYDIHQQRTTGRILVGSLEGLFQIEGALLVPVRDLVSVCTPVYAILEDDQQRIWIGTDRGLIRSDRGQVARFTVRDGLSGQEINRDALVQTSDRHVWIGTDRGLSCFQSEYDVPPHPPKVQLTEFRLDGRELPLAGTIEPQIRGDLVVGFRGISFAGAGPVEYRCRLEGLDEEWMSGDLTASGHLRYTNLDPGEYRLHVAARSPRSEWSATLSSPLLSLRRPWYQRWWFLGLAALATLSAVGAPIAVGWLRRRSRQLQSLIDRRTQQLAESERRYREMFEHTPMVQLLVSPRSGRIVDANPAACDLLESSREKLKGKPFTELIPMGKEDLARALDLQDSTAMVWTSAPGSPEGVNQVDYEVHWCRYRLGGERVVQATVLDVGERRRLEEELRVTGKLKALGQLTGGVAHDFNNLLTTILGYSDLLLENCSKPQDAEMLEAIQRGGRRGAALVRHLLAFSSQQLLQPEVLPFNDILQDIARLLRHTLREDIQVETSFAADTGAIEADRGEIERVLLNLALNARDAMPSGGKLRFETSVVERCLGGQAPRTYVQLLVSDTGMGMSPEVQARIFEPFFTTKDAQEGSGLGLSTAYGIVEQSGGSIFVRSEPGVGTTFRVLLPRVRKKPVASLQEGPRSPMEPSRVRPGWTILLAEDDASIRSWTASSLRGSGFRVLEASDGREALEIGRSEEIDLLVTDVVMPELDGRELAQQLATRSPDLRVLYLSGFLGESAGQNLRGAGSDFLSKPFDARQLEARALELLHIG